MPNKRHYFDYTASWPLNEEAKEVLLSAQATGNPGGVHKEGRASLALIDGARETITHILGVSIRELFFTGSATEANNLAIQGAIWKYKEEHPAATPLVITTNIEHDSVRNTLTLLKERGLIEVETLVVTPDGSVEIEQLKELLAKEHVALVTTMSVNNEVGCVLPIEEIAQVLKKQRGEGVWPYYHVDAVQALAYLPSQPKELGADIVTYSAHKIGGPKGIGFCAVLDGSQRLSRILGGGGQELDLRPGTENAVGIAATGKALEVLVPHRETETERLHTLKKYLYEELSQRIDKMEINGPGLQNGMPHILNLYLPGCTAQDVVMLVDQEDCAISAGTACSTRSLVPSFAVAALYDQKRAQQSVRISMGPGTNKAGIDVLVSALAKTVQALRAY